MSEGSDVDLEDGELLSSEEEESGDKVRSTYREMGAVLHTS